MERFDQLWPGGPGYYYNTELFPPGTDSFLLSGFPVLKPGSRICDLGCGTGLLGTLLLARQPDLQITGIELQPDAVRLAEKTAVKNGDTPRMRTLLADLRDCRRLFPSGSFDLVISNPPYYAPDSGALSPSVSRRTARAETACTLTELCQAAAYLTRWGGRCCLVYKPERLTDLVCALREAALEPKRLRFVCKRSGAAPSLVLAEGRRGGKPGLTVLPSLILQTQDGVPTPEVDALYFRTKETSP